MLSFGNLLTPTLDPCSLSSLYASLLSTASLFLSTAPLVIGQFLLSSIKQLMVKLFGGEIHVLRNEWLGGWWWWWLVTGPASPFLPASQVPATSSTKCHLLLLQHAQPSPTSPPTFSPEHSCYMGPYFGTWVPMETLSTTWFSFFGSPFYQRLKP